MLPVNNAFWSLRSGEDCDTTWAPGYISDHGMKMAQMKVTLNLGGEYQASCNVEEQLTNDDLI